VLGIAQPSPPVFFLRVPTPPHRSSSSMAPALRVPLVFFLAPTSTRPPLGPCPPPHLPPPPSFYRSGTHRSSSLPPTFRQPQNSNLRASSSSLTLIRHPTRRRRRPHHHAPLLASPPHSTTVVALVDHPLRLTPLQFLLRLSLKENRRENMLRWPGPGGWHGGAPTRLTALKENRRKNMRRWPGQPGGTVALH
jgi:hypothetical protein